MAGGVVALDPTTGTLLWERLTDRAVHREPLDTDAGLLVDTQGELVSCE